MVHFLITDETIISGGIRYYHPLGLTFNLETIYVGKQYVDNANEYTIPSYTIWNTRLDFEKKWGGAYLAVNNLFDRDYYGYAYYSYGKFYVYPSPGRTFIGGIFVKF